ncbi:MAG: Ig-like domain-containing protein, partial [Chloroflexota bacterium]|nr:Ig-like domain-containing protein [Chloroflexota bacterium]
MGTVNEAPVSRNQAITTAEDTTKAVVLQATDADGDVLSYTVVRAPAHGTLSAISGNRLTYTPRANYNGSDSFTFRASDGKLVSNTATVSITITAVNDAPVASGQSATVDEDTNKAISLAAADVDGDALTFTIVTAPMHGELSGTGASRTYVPAQNYNGEDSFRYKVSDGRVESLVAAVSLTVRSVNDVPVFTDAATNTAQKIDEGQGLVALSATDIDGDTLSYSVASGALPTGLTLGSDGSFVGVSTSTSAGSYDATITVSDGRGGSASTSLSVTVDAVNEGTPDPADVAPAVEEGVATDIAEANEFLYTGENPVQTGVSEGTIEPLRVAVLRGKVTDRTSAPLMGVKVTVQGHPEYGQTLTRADGMFDLAVNGGGLLTLEYELEGYLPVQRQVKAPWRDYEWLPEVALIGLDNRVTTVDLDADVPMQVAQSNPVTDADGTRQATLLFPQDTTAEMTLPDGTKKPLTSLNVRATEYTVGENGPEAMPGELPATSGYTYAVELSVDEAMAAGATDVQFSQPVPFYVENFIGFPVGTPVPVGYYDREQGKWLAAPNGRVIKILSITEGKATLDLEGKGTAATAATLAGLGVTDAELVQLATLYSAGTELWRTPITHFTPWDCNWPYGPPDGATPPNQPSPTGGNSNNPDEDCLGAGSIIGCLNQTLGEAVGIKGTRYGLYYSSDRAPGNKAAYTLEIPLSGGSVPDVLRRIDLQINVAGQAHSLSFAASPNRSYTFVWNGKDAYGRESRGRHAVDVRVGYTYGVVYRTPATFARSFAMIGDGPISANRRSSEITVWQDWTGMIGAWNARGQGLGGWSLDAHHSYDPGGRMLLQGDGTRRSAEGVQNAVITTFAGDGHLDGPSGENIPATDATLNGPFDVEMDSDGTTYIVEWHLIRKVSPKGIIETIAGGDSYGYAGDGGPAKDARFHAPQGIGIGPDGSLYIADYGNQRIRKIGRDGIITMVAGNGTIGS